MHFYHGHPKCSLDFICGHEFVSGIAGKGDAVKKFNISDKVVVPFFTACLECYYCARGQASRCAKVSYTGTACLQTPLMVARLYVRCPLADTTFCQDTERHPGRDAGADG